MGSWWSPASRSPPLQNALVEQLERARPHPRRAPAVSKLIRLYEELRRMMTRLRWHQDDVDDITPSLWANRSRKSLSARDGANGVDEPAR